MNYEVSVSYQCLSGFHELCSDSGCACCCQHSKSAQNLTTGIDPVTSLTLEVLEKSIDSLPRIERIVIHARKASDLNDFLPADAVPITQNDSIILSAVAGVPVREDPYLPYGVFIMRYPERPLEEQIAVLDLRGKP